ncbi:Anthranilate phosphoribosyltransferase [Mixta intestinalis]|uniref:Anthranilate phosphoribosyltransferase n=1 Tax=Mixta intestinalis TaxID=1615494 RepID=A0A6P1PX12_9GAMM|nr:Anthranilate phosphoribosyltransferase [Mixta intestinalis]
MLQYSQLIKEVGRGKNHARDLDEETAYQLYRAMLNDEVPELELGALLVAMRIKGEGEAELAGFYRALQQRVLPLTPPAGKPLPIVIPSYNGARRQGNLTPLLALLLSRLGFPVVVHGVSEDATRVTSEAVFQALGIAPAADIAQAQTRLESGEPVFISVDTLCPPLAKQLGLRWRLGVRNSAHTLAKLITPFGETAALRLASVSHPEYIPRVGKFFSASGGIALLLNGTEGEVYANPLRCPSIAWINGAGAEPQELLARQPEQRCELPQSKDAATTAAWIQQVVEKARPVPQALRLQIACCYVASGRSTSLEAALAQLDAAGYPAQAEAGE